MPTASLTPTPTPTPSSTPTPLPEPTVTPPPAPVILAEPKEPGLPVVGNTFNRTRDALDSVAFEARQRITLVSLLCAALVFSVFLFAYLIRRRR